MKKNNVTIKTSKALALVVGASLLYSCGQTNFTAAPNSSLSTPVLFENTYKVGASQVEYVQPNLSENNTTLGFQIQDAQGNFIHDLSKSQIIVTENGQVINDLALNKNSVTHTATADILFAIDVTGSMAPTIEAAKRKLIDFVNNTRAQGYHTRMCLSTFGDYTVQKCTRFYDNDPNDASTETQVTELISEITKLKALTGAADPGGRDFDENPMRALIDAASAPWGSDSQRFVILVTDAGFLYSPGNSGDVGNVAPRFTDVLSAITQSRMKVFAVTPSRPGYERNFSTSPLQPGIVAHSEGQWYRYSDLVNGVITLNTVLNKILSSIDTTFFVDYTLTAQSTLDPSKPLSQRNIEITLVDPQLGTIKGLVITSNLPDGRTSDPKRFVISNKNVNPAKVQVYVDGVLKTSGFTLINQKEIEFAVAQPVNSRIVIKYEYQSIQDSISLTPIQVSVGVDKIEQLKFSINGIPVDGRYFTAIDLGLNLCSIILSDDIFGIDDPFGIIATGQLDISIRTK